MSPAAAASRGGRAVLQLESGEGRFFFDESELDEMEAELVRASAGRPRDSVFRRRESRRPRGGRSQGYVGITRLVEEVSRSYDEWVSNPGQELLLGAAALLAGNYLAHFLDTTFGQSGYWETVVSAVTTFFVERISREYYMVPARDRTPVLKMLNALRVGLLFGLILDALKLAG